MPLKKRESSHAPEGRAPEPVEVVVGELRHPDPERRWSAARRLGERPGAAAALAAALPGEADPRILEAIFTSLIRLGGEESAPFLLPLLRSDEAALRLGAIEALEAMPAALAAHIEGLLQDPDSDVRIFAVELTRKMPAEQALALLCRMLDREDHPNVCAAAVDVLAEIGSADAAPCLDRCRARFAGQAFLTFAITQALDGLSRTAT
ncbi:MAG TPA: HEAT repeat domain-containing protein [Xanthobacteraceae bacterium]|jgi:HEAT repeat protein|nr:HEAT repeat domain-containing protein [Xanthobacteraceae bacterium]